MMNKLTALNGIYLITDRQLSLARQMPIENMVQQAIEGGVRLIQYRNKQSSLSTKKYEAAIVAKLCRAHNVTFLVNDDIDIALAVDADGVHIGQDDTSLTKARALLGPDKIIGVSCYNSFDLAKQAQTDGADYVAFGRFYPSRSKPNASPATIDTLQKACQQLDMPICAIGGITPLNAPNLLNNGAHMLAVIHSILASPNIRRAAQEFTDLFHTKSPATDEIV